MSVESEFREEGLLERALYDVAFGVREGGDGEAITYCRFVSDLVEEIYLSAWDVH